jgi:hypothetical protein
MKKTITLLILFFGYAAIAQTVTTFAGKSNNDPFNNYESGGSADMTDTYFSLPEGICFDANGEMYVSERNKVRVLRGTKTYTRAGSLAQPSLSEGYKNGTGTQTTFRVPSGMTSDANGDIFVADADNHCIRKISKFVNVSNGQTVSTFAGANPTVGLPGNGTAGYANGNGTNARFNQPRDICIGPNGYFYVTEYLNFTVRKISPSGNVTTLAGDAGVEGTADGTGTAAKFGGPWGVAVLDANNIVVTDPWNTNIRKINMISGATTTLTGSTTGPDPRHVDGTLSQARFRKPQGITVVDGIIYVTDRNVIRAIDVANNSVTTFAGSTGSFSLTDGTGSNASFTEMSDIETDGEGNLFVSENSTLVASNVIRKVVIDNLAPIADFSAPTRSVVIDEKVTLSDISRGQTPTSRTWSIDRSTYTIHSGSLSSPTLELSFNAIGFYEIGLSITNDYGTDSKTVEAYFSVSTTGSVKKYAASDLIAVYPNPAHNEVQIELDASLNTPNTTVQLYDIKGQEITTLQGSGSFNTSALPNGTYYVTVVNEDVSFAKRFVVNH